MTHIPDCRSDKYYNEKYLDKADTAFIEGYDCAVEMICNLFNNLDVFPDFEELMNDNVAVIKDGKSEIATNAIEEWAEMERDTIITSMLDCYDEEKYEQIKKKVDGNENV